MILSPSPQASPVEGEEGASLLVGNFVWGLSLPSQPFPLRGEWVLQRAGLSSGRRFSPAERFLDCGIRRNDGWQFVAMHEDGGTAFRHAELPASPGRGSRIREDDGLEARVAGVHILVHGFWIPAFAGMMVIAPRFS